MTTPTTGYTETSRTSDGGVVTIVATAPGEDGTNTNTAGQNLGTRSSFVVQVDPVETETFENATISISIASFDDGLFVAINGVTIVNFNSGDWFFNANGTVRETGVNFKYDTLGNDSRWRPWNLAEGNPELRINTSTGTVELMVDTRFGTRENVLADIALEQNTLNTPSGFSNPTPNPLPDLDFVDGVTITTAYNNLNIQGFIGTQTITVTAEFTASTDIDGDGIPNNLDIDTDGDRIWDKYESENDSDGDGIADYRDTDSNGAAPDADTSRASLTAADIAALEGGGTSDRVNSGTYTNGDFSNRFILLSEADLELDFTEISNTAFSDVEYIDMNDGAAQTITLTLQDVIDMTNAENQLIIVGDGQDTVNAAGFELTTLQQSIQGEIFNIYALDDARLIIHQDVTVINT